MKFFSRILALVLSFCLLFGFMGCAADSVELIKKTGGDNSNSAAKDEKPIIDDVRAPFYVLVIGNDSRIGTREITNPNYADGTGRSDTMVLVRINPNNYSISLVSIPRDTTATLDGHTTKINEIYRVKGPEALVDNVSLLTGVSIDFYMDMGFVDFVNFVNALGGIEATVPIKMGWRDIIGGEMVTLSAGFQFLDGTQALTLARVRDAYALDVDACRQIQNRQIVQVAIEKVLKNPIDALKHIDALIENTKTNWPLEDMTGLILDFIANSYRVKFVSGSGPYAGGIDNSAGGLWLVPRDEAKWRELMQLIESGGDPTTLIPLPSVRAA